MDAADIATQREHILRLEALARNRASRPVHAAGPPPTRCEECGDPIPEARRAAVPGVRLCVTCQQKQER